MASEGSPRAVVADDSHFMRSVISDILVEDGIDVVAKVRDGREALAAVTEHDPDVVTMDVEMPGMDGIEATERIMAEQPTPVLMLSAHTNEDADVTFQALESGALDFFRKPGGEVSMEMTRLEDQLVETVLSDLPLAADLRVLVVQHMPDGFTGRFAERLDARSDKITANLQNTVMDMRLVPLKKVVGKFPRMVRDLSRDLDKDVEFTIEGEDIELDRTILTEVSDPLVHIIRNAIDHGIEAPDEREAAGKPPTGRVELRASRERDHVIIEVEDDGGGLDVEAIRRQAIEQGVRSPEELEAMDRSPVYDLVFHFGFSTADEVTDTSGRGVGMDVVHDTVTQLDGSVTVESEPGAGTTVSLRLPVTMAIVKDVAGDGMLVRIRESEHRVALHCDEVNSQEEVVVKPLEGILSGTPGLSGTAVLGDGNIVHILDVVTL